MLLDERGVGREAAQVRTGAEDLVAGAREHDRLDGVVVAGRLHGLDELAQKLAVERVALVGAVEGERRHAARHVVEQFFLVGHRGRHVTRFLALAKVRSATSRSVPHAAAESRDRLD